MKQLLAVLLLTPVLAIGAECETVTYSPVPKAGISKPRRVSSHTGVPHVRAKALPRAKVLAPRVTRVVSRFDCPPPHSDANPPPIQGLPPYIGTPPVWGYPYPMPEPTGPQPIRPGTPDDFPPGTSIPPYGSGPPWIPTNPNSPPPMGTPPVDVPEPPTLSIFLFGLALIVARRYIKWPNSSPAADAAENK